MPQHGLTPTPEHVDDGLARLLEIEQRLEARVRDAEQGSAQRLDAARAALARASGDRTAVIEEAAREEERVALEAHAVEMGRIQAESAADVQRLASFTDERIEQLAHRVAARIVSQQEAP